MKKYLERIILIFLLYLFFLKSSYAYIDPGTGSYVIQLIIGTILGLLFTLKMFWVKIKTFLKKR